MASHSSSSLGPRASRPHRARSASTTSAVELVAGSARLTALQAGETPAVPVKSLSGQVKVTTEGLGFRKFFAAANQPKKLVTFPGAGHNVFGSVGDRYVNLIEDFIREALKAPK